MFGGPHSKAATDRRKAQEAREHSARVRALLQKEDAAGTK